MFRPVNWCDFCNIDVVFELRKVFSSVFKIRALCVYDRVRCARRGGIRFTIGGNPFFLMVLIHNVGGAGDVRAVSIKGQYTGWVGMYRNWGSLWTCTTKIDGALTFRITTGDGKTLILYNAVRKGWRFGQTWEGSQFRWSRLYYMLVARWKPFQHKSHSCDQSTWTMVFIVTQF